MSRRNKRIRRGAALAKSAAKPAAPIMPFAARALPSASPASALVGAPLVTSPLVTSPLVTSLSVSASPSSPPPSPATSLLDIAAASRLRAAVDEKTLELGYSGLTQYGGYLYEEWQTALQGVKGRKTTREMSDNDATIGAILFAIEMLIRQVSWDAEPAPADEIPDRDIAEADAQFLRECMRDLGDTSWNDYVSEVLTMLPWGFSLFEEVFKFRRGCVGLGIKRSKYLDGRVGWARLAPRAQDTIDRWEFESNGDATAAIQMGPPNYVEVRLPLSKCVLHRVTTRKGNPEGRTLGVMRNAWRPWFFKRREEEYEAIGVERDLAGLPVAEVPMEYLYSSASTAEKAVVDEMKAMIRRIRRDEQEGILLPQLRDSAGNKLFDFRLLSSGGSRQFDTSAIIQRHARDIAMVVLADFIMLGHEAVGSFALASSKTNLFATALGGWLGSIAATINTTSVPRLFALNGTPPSRPLPKVAHGDIEGVDINELGDYITKLSGAGASLFPDDELEAWCRSLVPGMPQRGSRGLSLAGGSGGMSAASLPRRRA